MGGGGALDAFNKTIASNRSLLKKMSVFENLKRRGTYSKGQIYKYKKATQSVLLAIRAKIKKERYKNTIRQILIMMVSIGIVICAFWYANI